MIATVAEALTRIRRLPASHQYVLGCCAHNLWGDHPAHVLAALAQKGLLMATPQGDLFARPYAVAPLVRHAYGLWALDRLAPLGSP